MAIFNSYLYVYQRVDVLGVPMSIAELQPSMGDLEDHPTEVFVTVVVPYHIRPYKLWGYSFAVHSPYIGAIYGRYL